MFSFGIYKNKLYKTLIPFGIFITMLLTGLLGHFLIEQQKSSHFHYLSNLVAATQINSNVAVNLMSRAINDTFRNESITNWSHSHTSNQLYYNSISAIQQLKLITTDSSPISYDLAITTMNQGGFGEHPSSMVLKNTGTTDQMSFFYKEKGLKPEQLDAIGRHFTESTLPYVLPYYADSTLKSIYYIVKDSRNSSGLMCFITIPVSILTGQTSTDTFMLYSNGRLLASSPADKNHKFFQQLLAVLERGPSGGSDALKFQKHYVFTTSLSATGWDIAYVYNDFLPNGSQILFFLFLLAVSAFFFLIMATLLVEALYRPIKDVMRETADGKTDGKPMDEMKIIRQNSEKIKTLSKTLMEALAENSQMASQQQFRRLLFSPPPSSASEFPENRDSHVSDDSEEYSVALIEFQLAAEPTLPGYIAILKQDVQEFAMSEKDFIYVDLNFTQCAIIMKSGRTEELSKSLSPMINALGQKPENVSQWVALSSPKTGRSSIWLAYQESQRILEYKHLYHHSNILTYKQIESVDAVTYSYPLSTENRLVHCVLEGKEEALTIFDQLIRTNLVGKTLSIESIQSFIYALIGTVGRIFQELKTSPETLLSEEVNFKYLYEHWNDSVTVTTLRHTLSHILDAVTRRESHDDERMLGEMLQFIHHNYMDDIMLNDMADFVNISPKYCGILFKQLSEQNFKDYLNRFRVERAKEMLAQNPGIKISSLSLMVGFNSANSFIRVFGKYTGVTPKAYVEKLQG